MAQEVVLGIDIGGSLTKVGLVTREGNIIDKTIFKTNAQNPFPSFMEKLKLEVETLILKWDVDIQIRSIGVGAPNANPHTGQIENPPNLKWGKATPIAKIINQTFNLPVSLANDANAAALGEMVFGAAKGMKNFVALTLGTGLGSGIIVDGKLLIGEHGAAGEIGHVNVEPNGRECNCGLHGCLETYASVTGIKRTVFELLADMKIDSPLRGISFKDMRGTDISDAALKGDLIALTAFEKTGEILGSKMADTVAHLDPEAFILSGGLSKAGEILLRPIRTRMQQHLFNAYKGKIKVLLSTATSSNAVLGPAALAWLELENTALE
ncbi:ROK family protein [Maribacter arcticus]|uniref:Glucokinase n=1 Tax=Maribacter arcticus TaxID=561365 RepID=A0A1T4ZU71_9FLAO|nr:ROK family protein [Maribacter arcticus]SKB26059.1 glucokinase [Maribacter arcticus]